MSTAGGRAIIPHFGPISRETIKGKHMRNLRYIWCSRRLKFIVVACSMAFGNVAAAQIPDCEARANRPKPLPAEAAAYAKLNPLRNCSAKIDDATACNRFLGKGLDLLFHNQDFMTGKDSYMLANDIVNGLEQTGNAGWKKIGIATDQDVLASAQELANGGKAVVAARLGNKKPDGTRGPGHVVLILRGTLEVYQFMDFMWGSLKTPNSASFFLDKVDRMFVGCPLSTTWRRPDGVGLYYKP